MAPCFHPHPAIGKPVIVLTCQSHLYSCFTSSKGTWIKPKCHFVLQGWTQSGCCRSLQPHLLSLRLSVSTCRPCCLLLLEHSSLDPTSGPLPLTFPCHLAPYASLSSHISSERFSLTSCRIFLPPPSRSLHIIVFQSTSYY